MLYTSADERNDTRKADGLLDDLLKALKDAKNPEEIQRITEGLVHLSHSFLYRTRRRAVEPLIEKLYEDRYYSHDRDAYKSEPKIISSIVEALGKLGDERAVRPLLELVTNGWNLPSEPYFVHREANNTICVAAMRALREILENVHFPEVKSMLEMATEDSPLNHQFEAVRRGAYRYLELTKSMKKDAKALTNNRPYVSRPDTSVYYLAYRRKS